MSQGSNIDSDMVTNSEQAVFMAMAKLGLRGRIEQAIALQCLALRGSMHAESHGVYLVHLGALDS